jgi:hypothetical protein
MKRNSIRNMQQLYDHKKYKQIGNFRNIQDNFQNFSLYSSSASIKRSSQQQKESSESPRKQNHLGVISVINCKLDQASSNQKSPNPNLRHNVSSISKQL